LDAAQPVSAEISSDYTLFLTGYAGFGRRIGVMAESRIREQFVLLCFV
jgi:hypothetical protein